MFSFQWRVRRSSQQSEAFSLVRAAPPLAPGSDKPVLAPFTGHTPPTKESRGVRRSRSSVTPSQEVRVARRSLDTKLGANTTLAAVQDEEMQRDLENYFQRFGSIQRGRGGKQ